MEIRLAAPLTKDSIVDGPGLRAVIWTQGCPHKCPECHNPQTHSYDGGFIEDIEDICDQLVLLKLHQGITISGGEPFDQVKQCEKIAIQAILLGFDIWVYTGYLFEDIVKDPNKVQLLRFTDILIDGPFIADQKDLMLKYRGSKNQRIIDVQSSLDKGKIIIVNY